MSRNQQLLATFLLWYLMQYKIPCWMMNDAQKAAANYVPKNFGICSFLQNKKTKRLIF